MPPRDAPTAELGAPGITSGSLAGAGWLDTWETTTELAWPHSVHTFDRMRKDGHLSSALRSITLPIRRSRWFLEPDPEVRPAVYDLVRTDLGLVDAGRRRRRRQGIVWNELLAHALLELPFGHMVFEQVYELGPPPTPIDGVDEVAHLRKLGPRLPRTINGWDIARDGGLEAIVQLVPDANGFWRDQRIPIERLVVFCNEREGSDWAGTSILRPAYPHWLIKQQLMRIDAMAGERNGMGVPWVEFDEDNGASETVALDIAKKVRAGEEAGLATALGKYRFQLVGLQGQVRDILESIRYHDQEMGRLTLAMFLDLGHDNGARSLGDTFVEFFVMALQTVADDIADVVTEHVIRDLVEVNFGPDEPYPLLRCDEITADKAPTAEALKQLAESGYLIPDAELEVLLRRRYGFPIPPGMPTGPAPAIPVETGIDVEEPAGGEAPTLAELEARLARLRAGGPRVLPRL